MAIEGPTKKTSSAPQQAAAVPESPLTPEELKAAPRVVIEFLDSLNNFRPKGERENITMRILREQVFDGLGGTTDRLWGTYASTPPGDVYRFLISPQKNPFSKKEIPPLLRRASERQKETGSTIAMDWILDEGAMETQLKNFLLWVDRENGVKAAQKLSFGNAQNLMVHIFGGTNYFHAPIHLISNDIEGLKKQERDIKRDIARSDYRANLFRRLDSADMTAEEIGVEVSGDEKYLQSNPDGTIDMKIDWIEIRDLKTRDGHTPSADEWRDIANGLRIVALRNPHHARWISYDLNFEVRFTAGKTERAVLARVPRSELFGNLTDTDRDVVLNKIGEKLLEQAGPRPRFLKPCLVQDQLRFVLLDKEQYDGASTEHLASPEAEMLIKQFMHDDQKFGKKFLNGRAMLEQVFDKRAKEGELRITSTEVEQRKGMGKEADASLYSDWEKTEARLRAEHQDVPSHHQKFLRLRRFYEALSSFSYPHNSGIERLVRAFGAVVSRDSKLARIGEIGEVLYKLSAENKNALQKANTYFNHYYSVFEEMKLATADGKKKDAITLDAEAIAEHAREYLSGKKLARGTNVFQLAQSHGLAGKNPERRALALEEELKHEKEANVALSPEEAAMVAEFSEISEQLRALSFGITIPDPGSPRHELELALAMQLGHYDELAKKVISQVEKRDPRASESAQRLRVLLKERFGE